MKEPRRCLSLIKGRQHFVFRYSVGQEASLLSSFVELADDPESGFSWLDAAVLSFQLDGGGQGRAAAPAAKRG